MRFTSYAATDRHSNASAGWYRIASVKSSDARDSSSPTKSICGFEVAATSFSRGEACLEYMRLETDKSCNGSML